MIRPKVSPAPGGDFIRVTLQGDASGTPQNSPYNGAEQRYYVLYEGQPHTMYLAPDGRDKLARLRVQAGDEIELRHINGQKEQRMYEVRFAGEPAAAQPQPQPQPAQVRQMPTTSTRIANPEARPAYANGSPAPAIAYPQPQPKGTFSPHGHVMFFCLREAIAAAAEAEAFAKSINYPVEFQSEDIRAMAIHMSMKEGGR